MRAIREHKKRGRKNLGSSLPRLQRKGTPKSKKKNPWAIGGRDESRKGKYDNDTEREPHFKRLPLSGTSNKPKTGVIGEEN